METLRIVVANEPRSYREAISGVFRALRPFAEVVIAAPGDLDSEVARFAPHFVVCSLLTVTVEEVVPAWVELYPNHSPGATVGMGGVRTQFAGMDLEGLLATADRVQALFAASDGPPPETRARHGRAGA